jgi:hypothetical protein
MKYTVVDINRMRHYLACMYPTGVPYNESARDADVERRLQTHMMNETSADELKNEYEKYMAEDIRRWDEIQGREGKA